MNVLLLNTYDITGGAARAVYRIHKGLRQIGIDSRLMVMDKRSHDGSVTSIHSGFKKKLLGRYFLTDLLPLIFYPGRQRRTWSIGWKWNDLSRRIARKNPDLIHLNWVGRGFVPIRALCRFRVPIVWTLTDMWPFTGGCHFSHNCDRYHRSCGLCPQLSSHREKDLSRRIWRQKKKYWKGIDLTLVAPSKWMKQCAEASSLFHGHSVERIPFGLAPDVFKPADRLLSRGKWGFSPDRKIILTGGIKSTTDPRKGFKLLLAAIKTVSTRGWAKEAELVVFGARKPSRPPDMGLKTKYMGHIQDDAQLASLYAAADVFVAPSTQESFCQTVLEALSCGTPCVGFKVGGLPDMINHQHNGYLARAFDIRDLAEGIDRVITKKIWEAESILKWRKKQGRAFSDTEIARCYARLYDDVLRRRITAPRPKL